jgi:hypothetical protein
MPGEVGEVTRPGGLGPAPGITEAGNAAALSADGAATMIMTGESSGLEGEFLFSGVSTMVMGGQTLGETIVGGSASRTEPSIRYTYGAGRARR